MDYLVLYFIIILDAISSTCNTTAIISGILFTLMGAVYIVNYDKAVEDDRKVRIAIKPWMYLLSIVFSITTFLAIIVPTTKQAAVIYCLPKIVNNEQVQEIPDKLLELSNTWLDETIEKTTTKVIEVTIKKE